MRGTHADILMSRLRDVLISLTLLLAPSARLDGRALSQANYLSTCHSPRQPQAKSRSCRNTKRAMFPGRQRWLAPPRLRCAARIIDDLVPFPARADRALAARASEAVGAQPLAAFGAPGGAAGGIAGRAGVAPVEGPFFRIVAIAANGFVTAQKYLSIRGAP